jgi:ribosomal-protein-alanine N-acetyltransferase
MATIDQPVRIDAGTSIDLDAVMEVMDSAFGDEFGEAWTRSQLSGILPMSGVELRVAKDSANEAMLGFSLTRTVADESELLLLAVDRDNQRNGVGRRLLEDFVNSARRERAVRVHLEVRDGNPAISMYRAAGFLPVGRRRNYYQGASGMRFDAVTLALLL